MTSEPDFTLAEAPSLYALDGAPAGAWAGYLAGPTAAFGATATLTQVFQDPGGTYLFLDAVPQSLSSFATSLGEVLPRLPPGVRFLWLANPNDPPASWQVQVLRAVSSGTGAAIAWSTARQALLGVGAYAVVVSAGAALTQAGAALGYGVAVDASGVVFTAPGGSWPAVAGTSCIPLAGPSLGALCAALILPNGGATPATSPDDLTRLAVQIRYAMPDDADPTLVQTVVLPVISQAGATLPVFLSFDPLRPSVASRSNLSFFAPDGSGTAPALGSTFVTSVGHGTTLTPRAAGAPLWSARLAFNASPVAAGGAGDPARADWYLTPDGAFTLVTTSNGANDRLTLGQSGIECIAIPQGGVIALFQAGQPAWAGGDDPPGEDGDPPLLSSLATTAYVSFLPASLGAAGVTYYAQPREAPLFTGASLGAGFLGFLEMPAATLPAWTAGGAAPPALPVAPCAGMAAALAPAARRLEASALTPARRAAVGLPSGAGAALLVAETAPVALDDPATPLAVTPQGLVAVLSPDRTAWAGVVLGNVPGAAYPQVALTAVGPALQQALQSSQLFFVVADAGTFMSASSVAYRLSPDNLPLLGPAGVPSTTVQALQSLLEAMSPPYPTFPTEAAFEDAVGATAGTYFPEVCSVAGQLEVDLDGWTFQLSPRSWRDGVDHPTIMIFKFSGRSLEELVGDTSAWGWPAAAGSSPATTQGAIQDIFEDASGSPAGSPRRLFYDTVVRDPTWNGVLFLNAPVAVAELPDALQFVAAGIDTTRFFAHHVGFALTPFSVDDAGAVTLGQTAVFGLVDYQDPSDLVLSATVSFAFKTTSLMARFANAALVDFSAEVELMINRLFGDELTKRPTDRGNNLVLSGGLQRQDGAPAYAFALRGPNVYTTSSSALSSVEILSAQIQTATGTGDAGTVVTDFLLGGNLRFEEHSPFDLFSYGPALAPEGQAPFDGYLRFAGLKVRMTFPLGAPETPSFTSGEARISFDLANSVARPASLIASFPLTLTGIVAAEPSGDEPGPSPEDLGYASVSAPIEQTPLAAPWYGLVLTLEIGTLGALAGSAALSLGVLAAWAPASGGGPHPVFVGLQLPGATDHGLDWSLQGVLRLGFRSAELMASDDGGARTYLLRLRRLALSILGWSFPPGNTDVVLFGDPGASGSAAIGWYGVYDDGAPDGATQAARRARRLRAGRRAPGAGR